MSPARAVGFMVVDAVAGDGYRGVDRQPWSVLSDAYHQRTLPPDVREAYERMDAARKCAWERICHDADDVRLMLEYSRRNGADACLISVASPHLSAIYEPMTDWDVGSAAHLGFDVVSIGEWSLIREMNDIGEWPLRNGAPEPLPSLLCSDAGCAADVEKRYRELVAQGCVEEIAAEAPCSNVEAVAVFAHDW